MDTERIPLYKEPSACLTTVLGANFYRPCFTMRIKPSDRVIFENNPLAEVVCQVRFDPLPSNEASVNAFSTGLVSLGYPVTSVEEVNMFMFQVGPQGMQSGEGNAPPLRVYHMSTAEGEWRVSHSSDFIAITCTKYTEWSDFKFRLTAVIDLYREKIGAGNSTRIGLRYRDIVDREKLGLEGKLWTELLQPFVLGPLAASDLCDGGVPEKNVASFVFQSNLLLEDCKLLFQGGLVQSIDSHKTAFVIDADFYLDSEDCVGCMAEKSRLDNALQRLHSNAGNLFAKTIQENLRVALGPRRPD